ncbi:MAG: hypothetical protein OSJ70_04975 [Bacilli bacterium]|nr:hypothetical protein [Bacilli bacterium]
MPLAIMVKHQTYNDGVLKYYNSTPEYNASKKKIGDKKTYLGMLNYELAYKRQQDYDFAESKSKKLDIKIKIPKIQFSTDYIIEINDEFYECYLCDDSDKFSNYLYLQKVKL